MTNEIERVDFSQPLTNGRGDTINFMGHVDGFLANCSVVENEDTSTVFVVDEYGYAVNSKDKYFRVQNRKQKYWVIFRRYEDGEIAARLVTKKPHFEVGYVTPANGTIIAIEEKIF